MNDRLTTFGEAVLPGSSELQTPEQRTETVALVASVIGPSFREQIAKAPKGVPVQIDGVTVVMGALAAPENN
jgi:hypothetical protein